MSIVKIHTPYITLGQFLKFTGLIDEGGAAKEFLASHEITVNGDAEARRGRKLHPGDKVVILDDEFVIEAAHVLD